MDKESSRTRLLLMVTLGVFFLAVSHLWLYSFLNDIATNIRRDEMVSFAFDTGTFATLPPRTRDADDLLWAFRPERDPIFPNRPPQPVVIRVLLFDQHRQAPRPFRWEVWESNEVNRLAVDGWNRSQFFDYRGVELIPDLRYVDNYRLDIDNAQVWVIDMRHRGVDLLGSLLKLVSGIDRSHLHIVILDYRDFIPDRASCSDSRMAQLGHLLGPNRVRRVVQQVVTGRHWNQTRTFVDLGHPWRPEDCLGQATLHIPYMVRSDVIEAMEKRDHTQERTIDVAHFWSHCNATLAARGVKRRSPMSCLLRNAVTDVLTQMNATYNVLANAVSPMDRQGRQSVHLDYVDSLLCSKIVVVAQRDMWEDHYRLFEALISGALVLTDPMLTLPQGLMDRESVVVYHSLEELRGLIAYYLEHEEERLVIATTGRNIALTQHRTYHWMERLFFGKIITP